MTSHLEGFARFLRILEGLSRGSVDLYRKKVKEFITWSEQQLPPLSLIDLSLPKKGRRHIESYLEWCYYKGNSNRTRRTKFIALSKFFRYLVYEDILSDDITAGIPKPRVWHNVMQKYSKQEILAFFRACNITTDKGLRDVCIFILLAFCGLRAGEICGLTLSCINDDDGNIDILIPETIGKKHRGRKVYLWKSPGTLIQRYLMIRIGHGAQPKDPFIIGYRHGKPGHAPLAGSNLDAIIKWYAKKAQIRKTKITAHMFRATHASNLRYVRGYDAAAIAQRLGHSNIATTDSYLPERGRIDRQYSSLHEYWIDFLKLWDI